MYIILPSNTRLRIFGTPFLFLIMPFCVITELDWKKQHKEFHKELRLTHPVKQRSPHKNQYTFSWSRINEFLWVRHDQRQDITGKMGEILTIAPIHPVRRTIIPYYPDYPDLANPDDPDSPLQVWMKWTEQVLQIFVFVSYKNII